MDLGIAGLISEAGNAGTRSLSMAQAQFGASQLQAERDKMDNLRQDRLLEAQRGMHTETLQATAAEGAATRKSAEGIHATSEEAANVRSGQEITSRESISERGITSQEKIHNEANANALQIAREHNKVLKDLETIKISLSQKSTTAAEMNAIGNVLGDKRRELTTLNRELLQISADPMKADSLKNPPKAIQALLDDIEQSKTEVDRLQAQFDLRAKMEPATKLAPFKSPTFGASPGVAQTPGTMTVPAPSDEMQNQMRKSLVP